MRIVEIVIAAALLAIPTTAFAQDPSGSPARQTQDITDVPISESDFFHERFGKDTGGAAEAYSDSLRFAGCVIRMSEQGARTLLTLDSGSREEERQIRNILQRHKACAVRRASVPGVLLRGAIAETLWKNAGANPNPMKRTSVDIEDVENFIKAKPMGDGSNKAGGLPIYWVARCQVMALPEQAAKVLKATPGSAEEKAEVTALYSGSTVCGVTKGLEKTHAILARAALADAFYLDGNRASVAQSR